ncbi:MAG: hypothetical protein KF862_00145 [Chitinophagaceae bacterium]|nr:hypothetical protein [Chitinophagaceae bacterium]
MLESINLTDCIHNGFLNVHGAQLQLLAVLSSDDDKIQWGVFCFGDNFTYNKNNGKYNASTWKGDGFESLNNGKKSGDYPIVIITLTENTFNLTFKIIESDGVPKINFDRIYYFNNGNLDKNILPFYFQHLKSQFEISKEINYSENNFFCKIEKGSEGVANYFWLFQFNVDLNNKLKIPLPKNQLLPNGSPDFLTFIKESNRSVPYLKFRNSKIEWKDNKCIVYENNADKKNINFAFNDLIGTSFTDRFPNEKGIFLSNGSKELSIYYKKEENYKDGTGISSPFTNIKSVQLNNDIFVRYETTINNNNILSLGFKNINKSKNALKFVRKAQPFALLPDLSDLIPEKYTIHAHYKIDQQGANIVVTLQSSDIKINKPDSLKIGNTTHLKLDPIENDKNPKEKLPIIITEIPDFPEVNDNGTFARFLIGKYQIGKTTLIDGAFEFELNNEATYDEQNKYDHNGKISFVLQKKSTQTPLFLWQLTENDLKYEEEEENKRAFEIGYSIEDFSLPVKSVKPISQDLTSNEKYLAPSSTEAIVYGYGERQQKQLVVPVGKDNNATGKYYLCISESVNIGQDFRVDMRLIEVDPKAGDDSTTKISAVILDSSPQFVGLVNSNFLVQKGYDDGVWVLAQKIQTNLNEGVWEVYDDNPNQEGFHLVLPPQTIGEEFIKDDSVDEPDFPLKYKFGAPAILKIAGDKLEKKYVSPPWDLRKFWGKAGDIQPGLPLLRAEFELLYGLQGDLKPRNTLVGELGARLGDLPVPVNNNLAWQGTKEQVDAFYNYWINYLNYYRAWKSRLAILETYRKNDPGTEAAFIAPNMINEELMYKPRLDFEIDENRKQKIEEIKSEIEKINNMAVEVAFIEEKTQLELALQDEELINEINITGAQLASPIKNLNDETEINKLKISVDSFHKSKEGKTDNFLKGGFSYGFEDKEIYKSFLKTAIEDGSTSAELSGLAFSSQGGYGKQVARFDNDLTAIKSLTAMGRVHRYAVERIGRIGVFWHKAKHVIEYERTVVISPYEKENQKKLPGRPVVRKIREYIEILEPEKKYPDFDNHSPKDTGAVNACVFKSTIIPVSNSWGRLVYAPPEDPKKPDERALVGWEVPLWYPRADEKLFPKPQVFLMLEPPKDSNMDHSKANLAEPENLVFYTAYKSDREDGEKTITDDVSKWQPVYGVDFTDKPVFDESELDAAHTNIEGEHRLDIEMPNAIDVLPGHGRFTFRVESQLTPAGMANVYQPDSKLSGVLRTVSLQRNGEVTNIIEKKKNDFSLEVKEVFDEIFKSNSLAKIKDYLEKISKPLNITLKELQGFNTTGLGFLTNIIWNRIIQYSEEYIVSIKKKIEKLSEESDLKKLQIKFNLLLTNANEYELSYPELERIFELMHKIKNDESFLTKPIVQFIGKFKPDIENVEDIESVLQKGLDIIDGLGKLLNLFAKDDVNSIVLYIEEFKNKINAFKTEDSARRKGLYTSFVNDIKKINTQFKNSVKGFVELVGNFFKVENLKKKLVEDLIDSFKKNSTSELIKTIDLNCESSFKPFLGKLLDIFKTVEFLLILKDDVKQDIFAEIKWISEKADKIYRIEKRVGELKEELESKDPIRTARAATKIANELGADISEISSKIDQLDSAIASGGALKNSADNVLTNYRSVWEEITAPGMGLNRKTIALVVNKVNNPGELKQQLSITPCIAKYKQFESDLNALGVRLPVTHIFNELIPPAKEWLKKRNREAKDYFNQFNFSEILPNIGAMDFAGMFPGFKMPDNFAEHIKFSQGIDKLNLSAWANVSLDYPMPKEETMFSIAMAKVTLSDARFKAEIQGSINADGDLSRREYGELKGDFNIFMGSNKLMTFKDTKVVYKDGRLKFDLDPRKMEMSGVLKMITDATKNLNIAGGKGDTDGAGEDSKSPFKIKVLKTGVTTFLPNANTIFNGSNNSLPEIPYGIKANLDLEPVNVGGGTTSLTNLFFGAQFMLRFFNPDQKKLEFLTGLGFYVSRREAPFNFTAFIFGGGGFVETNIYYSAKTGAAIAFAMSVHGSAGLCFNIGWASGSVFVYLGIEGQYSYSNQVGSAMSFVVFVQLVGTLNILGLVSVYLLVRLALIYGKGTLIGEGHIAIKIKICWCLKISVSKTFHKQFAGSQQPANTQASISNSLG